MSARELLLDAFRDQVAIGGYDSATLEAVARRAGLSKGGLLYHFNTKAALIEGLAQRLQAMTDANVEEAKATQTTARTFLETSLPDEDEARAYWAVFAAARSGSADVSESTRKTLIDVFEVWTRNLRAAVPDPVTADIIRLVGDGLYLAAVTGLPVPSTARLRALFDRLEALAHLNET